MAEWKPKAIILDMIKLGPIADEMGRALKRVTDIDDDQRIAVLGLVVYSAHSGEVERAKSNMSSILDGVHELMERIENDSPKNC